MPAVALVTIWWTAGFSILLFLAGLRAIPAEIYEAAALDNAGRWTTFRRITWPLLWPVTSLVFTIQLILQLKIFDQVYLFSIGGRPNDNMVLVYYVFQRAFQQNQGGRAAAVAVVAVRARRRRLGAAVPAAAPRRRTPPMTAPDRATRWNLWGGVITVADRASARVLWAFPLYWGVISSLKPEDEVVRPYIELWPDTLTFQHYVYALTATQIGAWYVNSIVGGGRRHRHHRRSSMLCGYAISQLRFPGPDRALVADPGLLHGSDRRR